MIFNDLEEFKINIQNRKRLLGLDLGKKNIGVAISDRDRNIATPKFVINRKSNEKDTDTIFKYIIDSDVGGIVVGLPLNSYEQETKSSKFVRSFTRFLDEEISKKLFIPIFFQNEYLTSFEAEDFLIDTMSTKYRKTKEIVDKVAAHYILQSVLDRLKC